MAIFVNVVM